MSRRSVGLAVIAIGVIVVAVAALADQIGVGGEGADTFGWKQIVGVVVGVAITVAGYITVMLGEKPAPGLDTEE